VEHESPVDALDPVEEMGGVPGDDPRRAASRFLKDGGTPPGALFAKSAGLCLSSYSR
jgi:hypothetical protein